MLLIVAVTASLGNWQLDRAAEKRIAQAARDAALAAPPAAIDADSLPALLAADKVLGHKVALTGHWVPNSTVYLDNRSHNEQAGFQVFAALALAKGAATNATPAHVLVLRGWAPRNIRDRTALPPLPEQTGQIVVAGLAQADIEQSIVLGDDMAPAADQHLWQRVNLDRYARWSGLDLAPLVVRQTEATLAADTTGQPVADDALVRDWIKPGSMVDKHYGYAFQWFAMALAMLMFWIWRTFMRKPGTASRAETGPTPVPEKD